MQPLLVHARHRGLVEGGEVEAIAPTRPHRQGDQVDHATCYPTPRYIC